MIAELLLALLIGFLIGLVIGFIGWMLFTKWVVRERVHRLQRQGRLTPDEALRLLDLFDER